MTATTEESDRGRRLTGQGVFLWLFAFFGITFAVNGVFIYFAVSTFPGVEVASSYKAGQEFEGEIALRDVLTLSLSFDHRLVDGEQGARFLAAVGDVLREPGRAMLLS